MTADEILEHHIAICEEAYQLLSEESNILKQQQSELGEDFISRKTELLDRIDQSLIGLKSINNSPQAKSAHTRALISKAQQRLMQVLLLDRNNERLLKEHHKKTEKRTESAAIQDESKKRIQRAYDMYNQLGGEEEEDYL